MVQTHPEEENYYVIPVSASKVDARDARKSSRLQLLLMLEHSAKFGLSGNDIRQHCNLLSLPQTPYGRLLLQLGLLELQLRHLVLFLY